MAWMLRCFNSHLLFKRLLREAQAAASQRGGSRVERPYNRRTNDLGADRGAARCRRAQPFQGGGSAVRSAPYEAATGSRQIRLGPELRPAHRGCRGGCPGRHRLQTQPFDQLDRHQRRISRRSLCDDPGQATERVDALTERRCERSCCPVNGQR